MDRNHLFRKGSTVGIIFLFFGITFIPSINAESSSNSISFGNSVVPTSSENYSYWNITLPTVHINYEKNKWKWGVAQFEDFEPVFDMNLSHFEHNMILIGFNETVKCHTQGQLRPAFFIVTLELFCNGSYFLGFSVGDKSLSKWNWTTQEHNGYLGISKGANITIDLQGRITVTGIPLRLHFLYLSLPLAILWYIISKKRLLPFEERHGTTAEFTLHVHS